MEALGFWILAATRAESAGAALGLAVLSSCFLLALYPPRRTELQGTPHRVPNIAFMAALIWLTLLVGSAFDSPEPVKAQLSLPHLWLECIVQLAVVTIVGSAYLFSRPSADVPPPAEPLEGESETHGAAPPSDTPPPPSFLAGDRAHHLGVGLTVGLASLLPTLLLSLLLAPDRQAGDTHILLRTLEGKGWDYLIPIVLAAAVLAPLTEELLFRVIFQGWFADRVGKLAVPLTAGLFCIVHRPSDAALLLPLAVTLGLLYEYRRSYMEVVAAHAAFNGANLFAAVNAS